MCYNTYIQSEFGAGEVIKKMEDTYTLSLLGLFFCQLCLPLAASLIAALLLLPEALLLLQSQCDPQGPLLLLLEPCAVQRVPAL